MATLNRKFLSSLGIEDDKADQILERHSDVVSEIKDERDTLKAEVEKLPEIQKQLDAYKKAEEQGEKDPYKVKYEALKEEFKDFKDGIKAQEAKAKKADAFKALLKEAGVSEKRIDAVLKVSDVDAIEFDDEGKVKDADKLKESIKKEWSDFITTASSEGANTATPPASNNNKNVMTRKEIMAIKDTSERQKAWGEYLTSNQKGN